MIKATNAGGLAAKPRPKPKKEPEQEPASQKEPEPPPKKEPSWDKAYVDASLELARDINCPELAVVTLLRQRTNYNLAHGKGEWVELGNKTLDELGISKHQKYRVLEKMVAAGWVEVKMGKAGQAPTLVRMLRRI